MKIFRKFLLILSALFGLAVLGIASVLVYASTDKEDSFYVVDAELSDPDYLRSVNDESGSQPYEAKHFGVSAHRLKQGKGVVFGYRFFSGGSITTTDLESYRKLTAWIPADASSLEVNLADTGAAVVFYSRGGSAWPRRDCTSRLSTGSLKVERRGETYRVAVHGQTMPAIEGAFGKRCAAQPVDIEFTANPLSIDRITPWLGAEGRHIYQETYR